MGSNFKSQQVGDLSAIELVKVFDQMQAEAEDRSGHQEGYSGDWNVIQGMTIERGRLFETRALARDFACDHYDKHRGCVAVLFLDEPIKGLTPARTREILDARKAMDAAVADANKGKAMGLDLKNRAELAWVKWVIAKTREAKSKTRGCTCGSQIAVAYIKAPKDGHVFRGYFEFRDTIAGALSCPVCGKAEFFVSDTDRAKKAGFLRAEEKAEKDLETRLKSIAKKAKYPKLSVLIAGWANY